MSDCDDDMSWWRFLELAGIAIAAVGLALWIACIVGCSSSTQEIAKDANAVRDIVSSTADSIVSHAEESKRLLVEFGVDMDAAAKTAIAGHQDAIITEARGAEEKVGGLVDDIQEDLTGVEDSKGIIERLLDNIVWIVVGVAAIFFLWRFGPFIAAWLGIFTPKSTKRNASFAAEAIVKGTACSEMKASIAANRASDPKFEVAYNRAVKREIVRRAPRGHGK